MSREKENKCLRKQSNGISPKFTGPVPYYSLSADLAERGQTGR